MTTYTRRCQGGARRPPWPARQQPAQCVVRANQVCIWLAVSARKRGRGAVLWPPQATVVAMVGLETRVFRYIGNVCLSGVLDGNTNGGTPHCIFRREHRNYTHNSVRNGSLCPMSSAGSLLLASPAGKPHSRNACSSVPGRLGANPARRQAYAPPASRLCSWVMSQWCQWLGSATAEVTLVSAQSTNAVMTIDWT